MRGILANKELIIILAEVSTTVFQGPSYFYDKYEYTMVWNYNRTANREQVNKTMKLK